MKTLRRKTLRRAARRGFTTLVVIMSMMVLAGAIAGMSNLFAHEIARTRAVRAQIQLRQLLFAAAPAARQELASNGTTMRDVAVALPLEQATLLLHIAPATGGSQVNVTAAFKDFKSAEVLTFSPNFDLTSCTLTQTHGE